MKKPIEKLDIEKLGIFYRKDDIGQDVESFDICEGADVVACKVNELIDYLFPEEGGEKCSKENGMMICYCGKCKPEDYPLPADFPKPSERCAKCNNPFLPHHNQHRIGGKPYHTGCAKKLEPSDEWEERFDKKFACYPINICADGGESSLQMDLKDFIRFERIITYQQGREDMKAELRGKVKEMEKETTMNGNLPLVHVNKGFNQALETFLELLS